MSHALSKLATQNWGRRNKHTQRSPETLQTPIPSRQRHQHSRFVSKSSGLSLLPAFSSAHQKHTKQATNEAIHICFTHWETRQPRLQRPVHHCNTARANTTERTPSTQRTSLTMQASHKKHTQLGRLAPIGSSMEDINH